MPLYPPKWGTFFLANFSDPVTEKIIQKKHPYIPIPHDFSGTNSLRPKSCSPWPVCLAPLSWRMPFLAVGCTWGFCGRGLELNGSDWKLSVIHGVHGCPDIYYTMYVRVKILCTLHPNFNKWVCWFLFVILHRINLFDELFGHCRFGAIGLSIWRWQVISWCNLRSQSML